MPNWLLVYLKVTISILYNELEVGTNSGRVESKAESCWQPNPLHCSPVSFTKQMKTSRVWKQSSAIPQIPQWWMEKRNLECTQTIFQASVRLLPPCRSSALRVPQASSLTVVLHMKYIQTLTLFYFYCMVLK